METIDNVLKYIQIYTECNDFTLQRIRVLLEKLPKETIVEKVVQDTQIMYIQKKTYKEYAEIGKWADKYFKTNGVTYKEVAANNREPKTLRVRNQFCIEAFKNGYAYKLSLIHI